MPNNREVAIRRAASLAKRLKGDKSFQAEYKQFMDKMLEQDYAEKIPLDQLHVVEGKTWYVPHHGVYHRRKGGFKLTKWVSNSKKVLEVIPENERADMVKDLELDRKDPPIERVLGIQWNLEDDTFGFKVFVNRKPVTRRGILSTNSSFHEEVEALQKGKQVKLTSNISSLDPILENGILRHAELSRNVSSADVFKEKRENRRWQISVQNGSPQTYHLLPIATKTKKLLVVQANPVQDLKRQIGRSRIYILPNSHVSLFRQATASLSQSSEGRSSAISAAETRNSPVLPQLCQVSPSVHSEMATSASVSESNVVDLTGQDENNGHIYVNAGTPEEMENLADIIRDFKRENISEHSTLTVVARRRRILHSAITALNKGYFDWHKRPQIEFVGEMADDYGGPTREFFSFVEDHDRMTSLNIMGNASKTLWTNKINFILLLFTFVVKLIIFEWMPQDDPR
ncbi:hypothetical protein SRHO_G00339580 [Serrasalmus rhombeus]